MSDKPSLKPFYQLLRDRMEENGISLAMRSHFEIRVPDEMLVEHGYVRLTSAINSFMDRETSIARFAWSIKDLGGKPRTEWIGKQLITFVIDTTVLMKQIKAQETLLEFRELTKDLQGAHLQEVALAATVELNEFIIKCCNRLSDELATIAGLMLKAAEGRPSPEALRLHISDEDLLKFGFTAVEKAIDRVMEGSALPEHSWNLIDPADHTVGKMRLSVQIVEWCINTSVFKIDYTKT